MISLNFISHIVLILSLPFTIISITTGENSSQDVRTVPPISTTSGRVLPVATENGTSTTQCTTNCLEEAFTEDLRTRTKGCPKIQQNYLINYLPNGNGNSTAGISRTVPSIIDNIEQCVSLCCQVDTCNFAILRNATCQLFFCTYGVGVCMPKEVDISEVKPVTEGSDIKLVLIRPPVPNIRPNSACEVEGCRVNENCYPKNTRARNGYCGCQLEPLPFIFNSTWTCERIPSVEELETLQLSIGSDKKTNSVIPISTSTTPMDVVTTLEVFVLSKNITLPENEVFLSAIATPPSLIDHPYSYEWKLIDHPDNDQGITEAQTTATLHLTHLIQGSYNFQVIVKSSDVTGSANVTVNVFPPKRTNQSPIAIISPPQQTIQLPTNSAVLDGTSSTDDDKIVSYKWELQKGPIGFSSTAEQKNSSTLQINDLVPGNYTFKLTVEDADHATNSTTANVTVMKEIDYPPTANAGKDIVIYLPQTSVTLNGNASTDDKKIVHWEWKATGDKKAVDMQDTHTAYLKLSGLEEGLYQFELTVTDEAGQVSNPSVVHLFVKKPSGNPPKADAGVDQTIALPQTWTMLDASGSKADTKVVKWKWIELTGPNNVTLNGSSEERVNVTGLTKGDYEFQVEIEDDAKLTAKATVKVIVTQRTNESPKANAGEDVTVTLPISFVQLDGSASKDDVEISEWKWERQADSLTAGIILGDSDTTSHLKVGELVPGKYVFKLTVKDEQGLSDEDSVTLLVLEDPLKKSLIEVVLGVKLSRFTESDKQKFLQQMTLLVHETKLISHHVSNQFDSEFARIYLYGVNLKNETREALSLSGELREKLRRDVGLLDFPVESIDTALCLNPCSGHGTCHDFANHRECICDAFWMENYIKRHFGSGEQNCGWSKIYVVVIVSFLFMMKLSLVWSLLYLFRRNSHQIRGALSGKLENGWVNANPRNGSHKRHNGSGGGNSSHKAKQYTLLEEDELEMESRADEPESDDSDSDESLIFERGKEVGSKSVSTSLLKTSVPKSGPSTLNGLPRNGILKKPRPGIRT